MRAGIEVSFISRTIVRALAMGDDRRTVDGVGEGFQKGRGADQRKRSGILAQFPHIDLAVQKVGVFAKVVKLDTPLKHGDRVEIYRPITCDPKAVRKKADGDDTGAKAEAMTA